MCERESYKIYTFRCVGDSRQQQQQKKINPLQRGRAPVKLTSAARIPVAAKICT